MQLPARSCSCIASALTLVVLLCCSRTATAQPTPAQMLLTFAIDYAADPALETLTFGIVVDGRWWTVSTDVATAKANGVADIYPGEPPLPTFYFSLDAATLGQLYRNELTPLTALSKAHPADRSPLDVAVMPGYEPGAGFHAMTLSVAFHFWTRDLPEKIPYGGEYTRMLHGVQAAVLFEQPGFRSTFLQILPGQHANEDPEDQVHAFPELFIVIDGGTAQARVGGRQFELRGREAIFIPAGVAHEFWNHGGIAAEGFLLVFGEGA